LTKIKVGVIGAGYWGPNLIRNFYQIPEAEILMVCDQRVERLEHIKGLYPEVETSQDYKDLLASDVEAVAIATPVTSHSRIAMDCLQAGKHVLIEKPLACNSQEARTIVDAGQKAGLIVMTGHTFLYNPAVVALKNIISSGEIGEVYYANCTRVNLGLYQKDVNVLWDLAPHDVSILMYVLGMSPLSASAHGGRFVKSDMHDVAYLSIYFPNDIMADIRVSWLDPNKIRNITIVGSKKMLVYDDIETEEKIKIYDKGVEVQPYTDTLADFHLAYRYGDVTTYPVEKYEPLRAECRDFLACIAEGSTPRSDGYTGLRVVQVLEAAQTSLYNGGVKEDILW
jgi:predicted dehydrogenase